MKFISELLSTFFCRRIQTEFSTMPRVMIKGGVWRNTEDEIMKAAVMKYGECDTNHEVIIFMFSSW